MNKKVIAIILTLFCLIGALGLSACAPSDDPVIYKSYRLELLTAKSETGDIREINRTSEFAPITDKFTEYIAVSEDYITINNIKTPYSLTDDGRVTLHNPTLNNIYFNIRASNRQDALNYITCETMDSGNTFYYTFIETKSAQSERCFGFYFDYNRKNISFDSLKDKRVISGIPIGILPSPVDNSGKAQFLGWYITPDVTWRDAFKPYKIDENTEATIWDNHRRLVAKWSDDAVQSTVTITFDYQGGGTDNRPHNRVVNKGDEIGVLPTTAKSGYTFLGWNTLPNGLGAPVSYNYKVTSDATIYANWKKNGSIPDPDPVKKNYTLTSLTTKLGNIEQPIDINDANYAPVIDMYGRTLTITANEINFTGTALSLYNPCAYTMSGINVIFSDSNLHAFNLVTLSNNVFKIGIDNSGSQLFFEYTLTT